MHSRHKKTALAGGLLKNRIELGLLGFGLALGFGFSGLALIAREATFLFFSFVMLFAHKNLYNTNAVRLFKVLL